MYMNKKKRRISGEKYKCSRSDQPRCQAADQIIPSEWGALNMSLSWAVRQSEP
jgi:hypothetical protein